LRSRELSSRRSRLDLFCWEHVRCFTLRAELEEVRVALSTLEKSATPSSIPTCEFCDAQSELMEEVKGVRDNMEYENTHLREVLSLVSSNEL